MFTTPAARLGEPHDFGKPAGDQRGRRVVTQLETAHDSRRDRDDVLDRSPDLHTDDVRVRVQTEVGCGKLALQVPSQFIVGTRDHQRRWFSVRDFQGEGRSGDRRDARSELRFDDVVDHLRHAHQRLVLDALVAVTKTISGFRYGSILP